ncbi:hypothetical protein chiPu_0031947 [Chiloscyllium punctatum]|uniref:DUF427 domain-containing protein n=1 Tax=Chiloscyllium punctatum TaxID=137246 RepID=A0A401TZ19_CHIPU|nr:hypothetical protein [Chiloscyllium punctatum]
MDAPGGSWCEFKGHAKYWSLDVDGRTSERAAWSYPSPSLAFSDIADHIAFYASRVDECWVDDERVQPQEGDFYGGWITSRIVGPSGQRGCRGIDRLVEFRRIRPTGCGVPVFAPPTGVVACAASVRDLPL